MKRENGVQARYEGIAQDLARRIASGELAIGTRLLGRSSLAGMYQVSPETIRRAVAILHERGAVQAIAGSGIRVLSPMAAQEYLDSVQAQSTLEESARELRHLLRERRELDQRIDQAMDRLLAHATGALAGRHVEEIAIKPDTWVVGRSLGEIRLRTTTGATVAAITRGEVDYFSPDTAMRFAPGDVLTIIGAEGARSLARMVLESQEAPAEFAGDR